MIDPRTVIRLCKLGLAATAALMVAVCALAVATRSPAANLACLILFGAAVAQFALWVMSTVLDKTGHLLVLPFARPRPPDTESLDGPQPDDDHPDDVPQRHEPA